MAKIGRERQRACSAAAGSGSTTRADGLWHCTWYGCDHPCHPSQRLFRHSDPLDIGLIISDRSKVASVKAKQKLEATHGES